MKRGVAECRFRSLRPTVVKMKIVFPREAHAAVDLDTAIADGPGGVAAVHFGDGNGDRRRRRIFFERPTGIVRRRTGALGFQVHLRALMLDGLKDSNGLPKLFSSLGIFDRNVEGPLHAPD